jgi:hypothetical protein
MKIRKAKSKLFTNADIYYVPSKSGGDEHIVVQVDGRLFCDCKDFMTRRLPLLTSPGFSMCTHGKQVAAQFGVIRPVTKPAKVFNIFRKSPTAGWVESQLGSKNQYSTHEEAQAELDRHLRQCEVGQHKCPHTRKVFEVQDGKPIIEDKKYGVFFTLGGRPMRSEELPKVYPTHEAAQNAIKRCGHNGTLVDFYVQEIS